MIVKDCRKLKKNLPEHSLSSGEYYKDSPLAINGCSNYKTAQFTKEHIWFNGYNPNDENDDLGHETFVMSREGSNGFAFCKTTRKPYDLMVQACLLIYKYYSPKTIDLGSDGDAEDWKVAVDFVNDTLGMSINNPFKS